MKWFFPYLQLQGKRRRHTLPVILFSTLLLTAALGGLLWLQCVSQEEASSSERIRIGVVGDLEDNYLSLGITALESFDSTRFTIELVQLAEETAARAALESGQISAYIRIPEGFVSSVTNGTNDRITLVLGGGQAGLGTQLVREFSEIVSAFITSGQSIIYAMGDFYREQGETGTNLTLAVERANFLLLNTVLAREGIYQVETIDASAGLSTAGYYLCAGLLLFVLLWGINGGPFLIQEDLSLRRMLKASGFSLPLQLLAEFIAYFLLLLESCLVIFSLLIAVSLYLGLGLPEADTLFSLLRFAAGTLPVLLFAAALQFFLFSVADGLISGLLLTFISTLSLGFLSGCFYPVAYFPATLQALASWLPSTLALHYLSSLLLYEVEAVQLLLLLFVSASLFLLAVLVQSLRLRRS